jgi:ribonuclease VapC
MIVDTSALVAIIAEEADANELAERLEDARGTVVLSAGNYLEAAIVLDGRRDPIITTKLDGLLKLMDIEIAPVTESQAKLARQAYRDFGKGSGHAAKLNFGDCFAYALATERGEPLVFKGDDFTHTGLRRG